MAQNSIQYFGSKPSNHTSLYLPSNSTSLRDSASTNTTSPAYSSSVLGDKSVAQLLWIFVSPAIFVPGIVGNILVLLVMRRRRMCCTSTSVYLRCMAIADICVLITGIIPEWLEASGVVIFKEIHPATCKLEKFLSFTVGDTAIWILVVFTIDRFLALVFPLQVNEVCLPSRAKYNALSVLLVAIAKNFHSFWTRGPQYEIKDNVTVLVRICGRPTPEMEYFERFIRPWIAFTLVSALPFITLCICNTCIIRALINVKRMRKGSTVTNSNDKTFYQMTIMCLSASFCFLVCITPSIVLLIGKPYWTKTDSEADAYYIAKAISNLLVYVNHSINFFLYCLTGKRFRMELILMCRGIDARGQRDSFESRVYRFTDVSKSPRMSRHNIYAINGDVQYSLVNSNRLQQPCPMINVKPEVVVSSLSSI